MPASVQRQAPSREALPTAGRGNRGSGLAPLIDGLVKAALLAFAAWTLVYDIGLAARLTTSVMLAMWAVCLVIIAAVLVRLRRPASADRQEEAAAPGSGVTSAGWRVLGIAGPVLGVAAGLAAGLHRSGVPWALTWLLGGASAAAALGWLLKTGHGRLRGQARPQAPAAGSLLAAGTALAAAVFSLFVVRPNGDDAYYLSRSVWTAQHGRIPVRDVLFTNQVIKPIAGQPPISSYEVLIGSLARLLGMPAGSLTYLVALPIFTFFAVWAMWLLVRRWAPGRHSLVFAVAMVYLAWSGTGSGSFGAWHLVRMWQGKAAFVSVLVPLLYVFLTDWAERGSWRDLAMVATAGVAGAGLSSAAVYVMPFIVAAVAGPLLLARQWRGGLGAMAALAYPLGAGLAVAALAPLAHIPNVRMPVTLMWAWVMLAGVLGVIGAIALWVAPRLARPGVPALITAGIGAVTAVMIIPGVLWAAASATGAGVVIYRTLWVIPAPALVGLLAAAPLPAVRLRAAAARLLTPVPAFAVCAVLILFGIPLWSARSSGTSIASYPAWKYRPASLSLARRVLQADHHPGDLLSTWDVMMAVPLLTSEVRVVIPRGYYMRAGLLSVSRQFLADRYLLTKLADGAAPLPSEAAVRAALARVGVGYACLDSRNTAALNMLTAAGFTGAVRVGGYQCVQNG